MHLKPIALAVAALAALATAPPPARAEDQIVVPILSYRTGPYSGSGIPFANGINDYLRMLNERDGGIGGVKIAVEECETGYDTKKGIECYEQLLGKRPVVMTPLSTGIVLSLIPRAAVDKIPILSIGYGLTASALGDTFPWVFNPPDTYWDSASVMIRYIGEQAGGLDKLKGKTIGFIYLDAPYGREPIPLLQQLAKDYGFDLKLYPVAGTEMQNQSSQWLNVRRDRPEYMMMFGWGAMNPTALKEAAKINFPMDHFVSIYWMSDDDARGAGDGSKGVKEVNWHGVGTDYPALQDIRKYVVDKQLTPTPKDEPGVVLYNRGVYNSVLIAEAIRNAQRLTGKKVVTGEDVRRGFELIDLTPARLKELGLDGFAQPLKLSCADHNGHGKLFVQQWDGAKWLKISGELAPLSDKVMPMIDAAAKDYVAKNSGWPKRSETCDKSS